MEAKTVYFENSGHENTEEVLSIARRRAAEMGIKTILVASTSGDTAVKATEVLNGLRIVVVSRITGHQEPDVQRFTEENRQKVESRDAVVLTATEAFGGVSRAMRNKFSMYLLGDIILNTLRIFGTGMQVACEISLMAADAGLVRTDEDVIAIGGTGRGADTAVVLTPVNSTRLFDLRIKEILCKPLLAAVPQSQPPSAAGHHH